MDASSLLSSVAGLLQRHGVEAVLIGNAAAAMQGAPVTTDDFDFLFRPTPRNLAKLEDVAGEIGADLVQPHYPLSDMYRILDISTGLQVDMMGKVYGVKSFESVRSRASSSTVDGQLVKVACLEDVIAMKRAAGRDKDVAVMPILEETLRAKKTSKR